MGFGFSPVSFYFCQDIENNTLGVIVEVNNTFCERHLYFSDGLPHREPLKKNFYVSPFNDLKGDYLFTFTAPTLKDCKIEIELEKEGEAHFTAGFSGQWKEIAEASVISYLAKTMLSPWMTLIWIHLQALRIFLKKVKYIPPQEDIDRVIAEATPDVQDYLWAIRDTLGRMSEINRLTWEDVDVKQLTVTLYTRKKRGGHLTPRKVPMTLRLHNILKRRHADRKRGIPWVFWHEFTSSKTGEKGIGPFTERKKIMRTLCKNAGVRYFRFHALRHASASVMDSKNVPIGAIQRILGHENRRTTEIYLHSIGGSERDAINVLEAESEKSLSKSLADKKKGQANTA